MAAEAFTVVSVIASIVQLIQFGDNVFSRLQEYRETSENVPNVLRASQAELPLLIESLQRTKQHLNPKDPLDEASAALKSVIDGCTSEIYELDTVIKTLIPGKNDSKFDKAKKAIRSMQKEDLIGKITSRIHVYVQTLTYYHASVSTRNHGKDIKEMKDLLSNIKLSIGNTKGTSPSQHLTFQYGESRDQESEYTGNIMASLNEKESRGAANTSYRRTSQSDAPDLEFKDYKKTNLTRSKTLDLQIEDSNYSVALNGEAIELESEPLDRVKVIQPLLEILERQVKERSQVTINHWLGVTAFNRIHNIQDDLDRQSELQLCGTCEWIFQKVKYREWMSDSFPNQTAKFLWVYGRAAFGKTVLCARLIRHFQAGHQLPVAMFFLTPNATHVEDLDFIVRSWIAQIVPMDSSLFSLVEERCESFYTTGQRASVNEIWTTLRALLLQKNQIMLVLDGLDEYRRVLDNRVDFLRRLKKATADTNTRVLILSRNEIDLKTDLHHKMIMICANSSNTRSQGKMLHQIHTCTLEMW